MLGDKATLEALKPTLTGAIRNWLEVICDSDDGDCIGWVGDDLAAIMSDAAWAAVMASIDVQQYMRRECIVND